MEVHILQVTHFISTQACTVEIQEWGYCLVFRSFKHTKPAKQTKLSVAPLYFHETSIAATHEICENPLIAMGWQSGFKQKKGSHRCHCRKKLTCTQKQLGLIFKTQLEFPVVRDHISTLSQISVYISMCHTCVEGSPAAAPKQRKYII